MLEEGNNQVMLLFVLGRTSKTIYWLNYIILKKKSLEEIFCKTYKATGEFNKYIINKPTLHKLKNK